MGLEVNLAVACWIWTRARNSKGYGMLRREGRTVLAHRHFWTLMRGPIPDGMQIDHLCRVPACVNPQHMEVVTSRENSLRGVGIPAVNAAKTHCPEGHAYAGTNLISEQGRYGTTRRCRECTSAKNARYYARHR